MARITSDEVEEILGFNYATISQPSLIPFINTANGVTNRLVVRAAEENLPVISSDTLILIEMWLSGYYYLKMDAPYKRKGTSKASGEFLREVDDYLKPAFALDPTGLLPEIVNAWPTVKGGWLGKTDIEALTYDERMGQT